MDQDSLAISHAAPLAAAPGKAPVRAVMRCGLGLLLLSCLLGTGTTHAQLLPQTRLGQNLLPVNPPATRIIGEPGSMRIAATHCPVPETAGLNPRRRIVDLAVQEWGFFGFPVLDQTAPPEPQPQGQGNPRRYRQPWFDPLESQRIAGSIAGYWAVTPDGAWILERQNEMWRGPLGIGERWRDPWSAAFISWVMCETGFAGEQFRRAIAHHSYIDQAIMERDAPAGGVYIAYDIGESPIEPGDMLCSARRHGYRNLADRRSRLGEGARSHCDIVVRVDGPGERILAIGGNVRGSVQLKLLYAPLRAGDASGSLHARVGHEGRAIFAHLKLRAAPIAFEALETSPTIRAIAGNSDARAALERRIALPLASVADSSADDS